MSCKVNRGKHGFYPTIADADTRVGSRSEFHVKTWHTCIACGERRGITEWGELIVKVDGDWEVKTP